jgi:putative glycosyltransferase (TIGR04348 family)
MTIRIVTPVPAHSRAGNRMTAARWARILRGLGYRVVIEQEYKGGSCDVLVALHARRSFPSIDRFRRQYPGRPLVVALTGTDLYHDIRTSRSARKSLELATRLIVLQPLGRAELAKHFAAKTRVILQSAVPARRVVPPKSEVFEVCVVGHLRAVKDPFRAAMASRLLPSESRLRVLQVGGALSSHMSRRASSEAARNARYTWLGELPQARALELLARCRLLVLSSKMEGGANVISEALAASVPILASRISGSVGILGRGYPGYFPPGNTSRLAALMRRAETDPEFYERLKHWCVRLQPTVDPSRERAAWKNLLEELTNDD